MTVTQKRADSYFPPGERVRLVGLVFQWDLAGGLSDESTTEYSKYINLHSKYYKF